MKSKPLAKSVPQPDIAAGQIWQMEGVACHIGQVGKTLVHYKLLKGDTVRAPSSLGNKEALTKHLKTKKAVLVKEADAPAPPPKSAAAPAAAAKKRKR
ncbi:MAG: hypothetical protein RL514_1219 [Verrucomicrobiota bacterium]|jgi:hypothetical protein